MKLASLCGRSAAVAGTSRPHAIRRLPLRLPRRLRRRTAAHLPRHLRCGTPAAAPARAAAKSGDAMEGLAAVYSDKLAGRKTASGQVFSQIEADCRASVAAVRHHGQGDEHQERQDRRSDVNDRGPKQAGRVIDLSSAAAAKIGIGKTAWRRSSSRSSARRRRRSERAAQCAQAPRAQSPSRCQIVVVSAAWFSV